LRLVTERSKLIQSLPKQGAMAVIFAPEAVVQDLLAPYHDRAVIAAINSPQKTVIAGERQAVSHICELLPAHDPTSQMLTVSPSFHSPLMDPTLDAFEETARQIAYRAPQVTLISNVTGEPLDRAPDPQYWRHHVRYPVRFADGIRTLHTLGYELF